MHDTEQIMKSLSASLCVRSRPKPSSAIDDCRLMRLPIDAMRCSLSTYDEEGPVVIFYK